MPEATINEHGQAPGWEDDVRADPNASRADRDADLELETR